MTAVAALANEEAPAANALAEFPDSKAVILAASAASLKGPANCFNPGIAETIFSSALKVFTPKLLAIVLETFSTSWSSVINCWVFGLGVNQRKSMHHSQSKSQTQTQTQTSFRFSNLK
jgi:hypothetical protein